MILAFALIPLATGCIAAELAEVGALEAGTEMGIATASEASAVRAAAQAGVELRGVAGGAEMLSEGALAEGGLERTLSELAGRHGTRLAWEDGVPTFNGRTLVFRDDGLIALRASGYDDAIIGRLSDQGELYDLSTTTLPERPIGRVRGTPRRATARALAEARDGSAVRSLIGRGQYVDVLRVRDGWYQVRIFDGTAWVPVPSLAIMVAAKASHPATPSTWIVRIDSLDRDSPAAAVLRAYENPDARRCEDYDLFSCYTIPIPFSLVDTYTATKLKVHHSRHGVRILWNGGHAAVVELRERFTNMITDKEEWGCVRILLERSTDQAMWKAIRRGPSWTCGERSPWG